VFCNFEIAQWLGKHGVDKTQPMNLGGRVQVPGIFAAVPYGIQLIGGPYVETQPAVVAAFRPKSAVRPAST
jgi:hypothetical protein